MKMMKGTVIDSYFSKNGDQKYHVQLTGLDKDTMDQLEARARGFARNMYSKIRDKKQTLEAYTEDYVAKNRMGEDSFRTSVPSVSAFGAYFIDENKDIVRVDDVVSHNKSEKELEQMRKAQTDSMFDNQLKELGIDVNAPVESIL